MCREITTSIGTTPSDQREKQLQEVGSPPTMISHGIIFFMVQTLAFGLASHCEPPCKAHLRFRLISYNLQTEKRNEPSHSTRSWQSWKSKQRTLAAKPKSRSEAESANNWRLGYHMVHSGPVWSRNYRDASQVTLPRRSFSATAFRIIFRMEMIIVWIARESLIGDIIVWSKARANTARQSTALRNGDIISPEV